MLTVFARTDEGAHVALLVESDMDGFEVGERYETTGLAGNDLRRLRYRRQQRQRPGDPSGAQGGARSRRGLPDPKGRARPHAVGLDAWTHNRAY